MRDKENWGFWTLLLLKEGGGGRGLHVSLRRKRELCRKQGVRSPAPDCVPELSTLSSLQDA